ncbi:interleukin-7 receptor subunit alpha isoform X2 [Toxotes jaculatrix]|uniref:interleukin-7 receptor subunit alpha isoform X2 n=1 Tax=Toxotes jaculatrix TaxID=941984 RepID=UPI001B3AD660|nr:interleukin-7 receptor subunit alpha isoform X2 [Toxotes jaculatrix]
MMFDRRIVLLPLLLLLLGGAQAQSGDGDTDEETRISCTSHIATEGNSLTCELLAGRNSEDDEDEDEGDSIEEMTLWYDAVITSDNIKHHDPTSQRNLCSPVHSYTDWSSDSVETKCVKDSGNTVRFRETPVAHFNLTVRLKRGRRISATVDLKKIVKPRPPQVWNVTVNQEANQVVISIRTPYHKDYLRVDNQLFQLHIWTTGSQMVQNISSENSMKIDMEHLQRSRQYHVRVRAIPIKFLRGSWSEWSETLNFSVSADVVPEDRQEEWVKLIVCVVPLVVVTFSVFFFWKNEIFTYMWPSIPHPKHTLVQICKPNKGLLLNFKPEVFSALKVDPQEKTEVQPSEETEPSLRPDSTRSNDPCSTQSSDCRSTTSVSTEELELSGLLSRSSSDGEDSLQSVSPSPVNVLQLGDGPHMPQPEPSSGGNKAEVFGASQQEEAYVTMSSFYQIK